MQFFIANKRGADPMPDEKDGESCSLKFLPLQEWVRVG